MRTRYLLIGGGLSSFQAIKLIRKHDQTGEICLVSEEPHLPYDRPPLSKEFLRGEKEREELQYEARDFYERNGVHLELETRATSLEAGDLRVTLDDDDDRTIQAESILLATGGAPVRLGITGEDLAGVHYLRTLDDAAAIRESAPAGARCVVVGAGFIGLEVAASLASSGCSVTVVEREKRVWPRFGDGELAAWLQREMESRGVRFRLGASVESIRGDDEVDSVCVGSEDLEADCVVIGCGINPATELARAAGLEVDDGIVVNEKMRTSAESVYAAGDVCCFPDPYFGDRRRVEHWGHAEYSGQVAGTNMAGGNMSYQLLSYVWSDIFDHHLEFAGDDRNFERVVVRGDRAASAFTSIYMAEGKVRGYVAVNSDRPREYGLLQKLIRSGTDISDDVENLADPEFELMELVRRRGAD